MHPPPPWYEGRGCAAGTQPVQVGDTAVCEPCAPGWRGTQDSLTGRRGCEPCPARELQPASGQTECEQCPLEGVDCTFQDQVMLRPGWFRPAASDNRTDNRTILDPVRCVHREGCLGGPNVSDASCAEGHVGPLCGTCLAGYYMGSGGCVECGDEDGAGSVALYVIGGLLLLFVAFLYLFMQMGRKPPPAATDADASESSDGGSRKRGRVRSLAAQLLQRSRTLGTIGKILLAHFQVLYAFSQLHSIRWPALFASYLSAFAPLSFQFLSALPLDCLVSMQINLQQRMLTMLVLPIVGAVTVLVLAMLAACCRLPRSERRLCAVAARPEVCTLQLWIVLLFYPSLAKTTLIPFDCVDVGDERLLRANPADSCEVGDWYTLATLGGLGTVIYSFGFPLLCFLVARAAHRAQVTSTSSAAIDEAGAATGPTTSEVATTGDGATSQVKRAKLLLYSYREGYWYWESLDIFRKYLLTSVVLVIEHDTLFQVYFGLVVCVCFALLVARHQPYASPLHGRVQMLALAQLAFTYMSGMLFFDDGGGTPLWWEEEEEERKWGIILIVANTLVFAALGVGLGDAVNASARAVQAELLSQREVQRRLEAELDAMRMALDDETSVDDPLQRVRISIEELDLDRAKVLGRGAFGEVRATTWRSTPVAVKMLHADLVSQAALLTRRPTAAAGFRDECLLMADLQHPNLVQFLGGSWDVDSGDMCLVLELCGGGSLADLLEGPVDPLGWIERRHPIVLGIARGMVYLHSQTPPIVHRDLKPANVLLDAAFVPKVSDLGTAIVLSEGMGENVAGSGSPLFQAPEILRREEADQSCDVWAFGCVACCVTTRADHAYEPLEPVKAVDLVSKWKLQPLVNMHCPIAEVISRATEFEYEERPSFAELVEMLEDEGVLGSARAEDRRHEELRSRRSRATASSMAGGGWGRHDDVPMPSQMPRPAGAGAGAAAGAAEDALRRTSCEAKLTEAQLGLDHRSGDVSHCSTSARDGVGAEPMSAAEKAAAKKRHLDARRGSLMAADSKRDLFDRGGHKGKDMPGKLQRESVTTTAQGAAVQASAARHTTTSDEAATDGATQAAADGQQHVHPALAGMLLRAESEAASTSACQTTSTFTV